ncbi:hypothetical protein KY385_03170 [Candidatus Parcubacteria bacterium]|nr:hypothetical protein [Candidatus Parcubacteria bacterium]
MVGSSETLGEKRHEASGSEAHPDEVAARVRAERVADRQACLERDARVATSIAESFGPAVEEIEEDIEEQKGLGRERTVKSWQTIYPYNSSTAVHRPIEVHELRGLRDELLEYFSEVGYKVTKFGDRSNNKERFERDGFPVPEGLAVETVGLGISWEEQTEQA